MVDKDLHGKLRDRGVGTSLVFREVERTSGRMRRVEGLGGVLDPALSRTNKKNLWGAHLWANYIQDSAIVEVVVVRHPEPAGVRLQSPHLLTTS